jgi:hypothetical protein
MWAQSRAGHTLVPEAALVSDGYDFTIVDQHQHGAMFRRLSVAPELASTRDHLGIIQPEYA